MSEQLGLGILLVVIGGVMEGTYAVSTRYTPRWKWEHIWGAGSLMGIVLIAWPVALLTVPELGQVFQQAGVNNLMVTASLGAGWGLGSIFFGLGVNAVGIAVGVSLILGLIAVFGSVLPMVMYKPEQLGTAGGHLVLAALAVMLVGIALCGYAGNLRERSLQEKALSARASAGGSVTTVTQAVEQKKPSYKVGLLFCFLSGLLSPMVNFALIKGDTLRALAIKHGASPLWATNAAWLLVFTVAYGVFILYALFLMIRNKTLSGLTAPGTGKYWGLAAIMGFLWAGGIVLYGTGAAFMGNLGAYAGWPLLLIAAIGASNLSGVIIGEWKGTGSKPGRVMALAMAVLFVAAVMLGFANRMLTA